MVEICVLTEVRVGAEMCILHSYMNVCCTSLVERVCVCLCGTHSHARRCSTRCGVVPVYHIHIHVYHARSSTT